MHVHLSAEQHFAATPAVAFALTLDPERFVAAFRGAGPIPALTRIAQLGEPAEGAERAVHSADGAVLRECITAFEPGARHAYALSGLKPPLAWLVRRGDAVVLTLVKGRLKITAPGKALGDGASGEAVRVVNLATSKTIDAHVLARGEVGVVAP